jgi:hypothetical protein
MKKKSIWATELHYAEDIEDNYTKFLIQSLSTHIGSPVK